MLLNSRCVGREPSIESLVCFWSNRYGWHCRTVWEFLVDLCKHNLFFCFGKLLCLAFLLCAVSAANASPTITRHGIDLSVNSSFVSNRTATAGSINTIAKPAHAKLADLGKQILQPPERPAGLLNVRSNSVRLLHRNILLLAGFLCVSLHRDRRVWLIALMGLLWICQAGIQTFPRLGHHFSHNSSTKQNIGSPLTYHAYLGRFYRSRSDIEGTRYIGLLRHVGGIPDAKSAIYSCISQPVVVFSNSFTLLQLRCLASKAEQFSCFSPAFIFQNLSRGPPLSVQKRFI